MKVVGITSWGEGCATEYPGVYARITVARWWIKDKLCHHSRDRNKFYFCENESKQKGKGQKE
jgi:secreted trypsin-like serine protease